MAFFYPKLRTLLYTIKVLAFAFGLSDNGYPPIYSQEVFNQVMEQVENYKTYEEE